MTQQKKYYHIADNGYIYDKRIFWGMIAICLLIMFSLFHQYDWNFKQRFYFKCNGPEACVNPIAKREFNAYNPYTGQDHKADCIEDWCDQEFLLPGEYGAKPPEGLFKHFPKIAIFLCFLGLLINHLIHNRGKKFGVKLNLSDKVLNRLRKWGNTLEEEDE